MIATRFKLVSYLGYSSSPEDGGDRPQQIYGLQFYFVQGERPSRFPGPINSGPKSSFSIKISIVINFKVETFPLQYSTDTKSTINKPI
jgi:hypothetical protein